MYWKTKNGISMNTAVQMHLTLNSNQLYNIQVIEILSARNITGCLCDLSSYIFCREKSSLKKLYYMKYGTKSKNCTLISTFVNQIKDEESIGIANKVY